MVDGTTAMMHIGELADRTELSLRTIRHYDEVGLLKPSGRTEGGFRLYTEGDFEKLMLIRRMKPLGFTLEQMRRLLEITQALEERDDADLRAELAEFVALAQTQKERLERQVTAAGEFLHQLDQI